jgi:hypothetical protein
MREWKANLKDEHPLSMIVMKMLLSRVIQIVTMMITFSWNLLAILNVCFSLSLSLSLFLFLYHILSFFRLMLCDVHFFVFTNLFISSAMTMEMYLKRLQELEEEDIQRAIQLSLQ